MKRWGYRALVVAFGLALGSGAGLAQQDRMNDYQRKLEDRLGALLKARSAASQAGERNLPAGGGPMTAKVNMNDSDRGKAKDVEIRLDMPMEDFEDFAPRAACEAAATPHKFETNSIFVRQTQAGRTGRVGMADAEKPGAKYAAGDHKGCEEDMARLINWH